MDVTNFTLTHGIPFSRSIRVVDGKNIWATLPDFEIRAQLRKGSDPGDRIIANLHEHMTTAYGTGGTANDIVITWSLTGEQVTTDVPRGGEYDLVISDAGDTDAHAIRLLVGQIVVKKLITAPSGDS